MSGRKRIKHQSLRAEDKGENETLCGALRRVTPVLELPPRKLTQRDINPHSRLARAILRSNNHVLLVQVMAMSLDLMRIECREPAGVSADKF